MANLLSNTTIGGYQSIHTGNIGSYAITSLSGYATQSWVQSQAYITSSNNVYYVNPGAGNGVGFWGQVPTTYGITMAHTSAGYGSIYDNSEYYLYFSIGNGSGRGFMFRNDYGVLAQIATNGWLMTRGEIYPGYNNNGGAGQTSYYIYGNTNNSGLRTNGNWLVNGNLYIGARDVWFSDWFNQDLKTSASPSFNTVSVNTLNSNEVNARYFTQSTNGVPSNNLGSPTVTEMALFDEQFNNKTAFYNPASLTFWTSSDGTNFTEYTGFDTTTKKRFLGGDSDSGVVIPNQTNRFRIELENSAGYVFLNQLYIYWSSNSHITKVHIWVRRCDNNQWYQWTDSNTQVSSWPGHLYLPFNGIPFYPGALASNGHFNKIRIEFIPTWSTGDYSTYPINLMRMQIWGGYPAGKRNIYTTDENQNVLFPAEVGSTSFYATNFRASNAFYLNGTSYYLNSYNGGIYTNARFETANNLVVGGSSSFAGGSTWFGGYGPGSGPGLGLENLGSFARFAFWGLDFYDWNNGVQMTIDNNYVSATNSFRAPIFYDSQNTDYYLDPNASTSLKIAGGIETTRSSGTMFSHAAMADAFGWNGDYGTYIGSNVGGTSYLYANGTFYTGGSFRTLIHSGNIGSQSVSYASTAGSAGTLTANATVGTLNTGSGNSFVAQGYNNNGGFAMNNGSTYWGLMWNYAPNDWRLGYGSQISQQGWNLRWDASGNVWANASMRSPIFYDSDDTSYYIDPNSSSRVSRLWVDKLGGIGTYSWVNAAITTSSIEIVNQASENGSLPPTLAFHWYGDGGPQFRLASDTSNILYLESAAANSANTATNSTTYFNSLRLICQDATGLYVNGNGVWHRGDFSSTNVSNWNTAYSWGNHASAGYLTGAHNHDDRYYTETESDGRYLRFTGAELTEGNYFYFRSNRGAYLGGLDSPSFQVYATGGNAAFMSFHRAGNYAVNFGLDADNIMRIGGWSAAANRWVLDMNGNNTVAGSFRAPIFYDSADTNYYGDFASTSVMNAIRFGTSTNNGTLGGVGDWGMRLTTDVGWIQFGPANSSYAHIYTDRPTFYFNKDILVNGYSVITAANIGSQSVSYASTAGSAPNGSNTNQFYDVNAGVGNGLRFWNGSNSYKISMGVGSLYQYGPVSDYSIKMQMNDGDTGRGFVWGRESYAPIAALNSTSGDMEIAGYMKSYGYRGNGNVGGTGAASWHPDGIYVGSTQWLYGNMHKNGSSIYDVGELKMNGGPYLQTYNDRNLIVRGSSSSDVGIEGKNAAGSNVFQIYGNGSDYGFLNGTWAAWDIRKTKNGAMYMNNDNTYYLQTNSTSNFVALNIQGNAVIHAGNIGSQSVSYASSAGSVAWTNVSSRPTALSQFSNDLGNYGGWLTTSGKAADSELLDGVDSAYFVRGTGGSTFGKRTTALGGDSTQGLASGFYDGSGMSNMPTSDWYHLIVNAHQNSYTGNQYEFQLATAFWDKSNFYVRSISPGDVGPWRTLVHNGNIGSQSVSYANSAGSASTAGSATMASQLSKYGDIYGDNWNSYYVSGKFIASAVLGMTGPNKPPTSYDYGVALSYGETGGPLMQWYFPENSSNGTTIFKKGVYRTGWNGNWSSWKTLVEQEGDLCAIVGGAGTGLEVQANVGYNQNPLTYFLLRGQADTSWKSFKVRLTGDAGGQDIEFRRIAENGADERMFWVPRVANQVIFDYFFVQASDERKKDNITIISNPIEKVKQLRGAEFDWNSGVNEGTHDVGLIAQDVEAVLPEAVTTQEDGYKNLAYNKVIPLLVEAMKEQQTMIEALKAEIELLKNK